jgi:hypothetical protein
MPRGWIGSFQLCDAPHACPANDEALIQEARAARLPPGAGALPLGDLLCAAPADVALSVEMPFPSLPSGARVELAYRSARRVVDHVRASRAEVPQSATAANRGR